jgi:hypothetical protein
LVIPAPDEWSSSTNSNGSRPYVNWFSCTVSSVNLKWP